MSLKDWLVSEVEPICEAEPAVLADYILALLKHDLPPDDLKKLFVAQLGDFLGDKTDPFVEKLFQHIGTRKAPPTGPRGQKRNNETFQSGPPGKIQRMEVDEPSDVMPIIKKEELCRDYHHRGYCARGDNCHYLHDERPDLSAALYAERPSVAPDPPYIIDTREAHGLPQRGRGRGRGGPPRGMHMQPPQMFGMPNQPMDRRGKFDMRPRSQDTLVVEGIPMEHLNFDAVSTFFRKFGNITNLSIDQMGMKALVSFSTPVEAKAAHSSPDPVFGNRFVKIYFQRLDEPVIPGPQHSPVMSAPPKSPMMVDTARDDAVAAAALEKAAAARKAAAESLQEKQQLQSDMLEKIELQKSLLARLEGIKSLSAEEKSSLMSQLREAASAVDAARAAVESKTPAKDLAAARSATPATMEENRAKLQALREEAASLGIDPSAPEAGPQMRFSGSRVRGRGRARARGYAPRGRGFPARGASFASRSLDLRPKKLLISGLKGDSDTLALKEQATILDAVFELEGEGSCSIAFKTRLEAEKFLAKGSSNLPVADPEAVRMRWSAQTPAAPASPSAGAATLEEDADMLQEEEDAEEDEETSWRR